MIQRLRRINYFFAYAVATIPLWHYIRDGRILALMVTVMILAYVMVVLSSVQAAQAILSSEKAKTVLPRWLPDKAKYHKWWMLVRHTLKWHLLLVPVKLGVALGFVHQLFVRWISVPVPQSYNYIAHNFGVDRLQLVPEAYPQYEVVIIAFLILFLFALLESMLLASLCLIPKQHHLLFQRKALVIVARLFLALASVGIAEVMFDIHPYNYYSYAGPCRLVPRYDENGDTIYLDEEWLIFEVTVENQMLCLERRTFETITTSLITPYTQGTLLSANVMRPLNQVTGEESGYGPYPDEYPYRNKTRNWDNRPFVARQIVAGLLGLMLYAGATWVILWFVEDEEGQSKLE